MVAHREVMRGTRVTREERRTYDEYGNHLSMVLFQGGSTPVDEYCWTHRLDERGRPMHSQARINRGDVVNVVRRYEGVFVVEISMRGPSSSHTQLERGDRGRLLGVNGTDHSCLSQQLWDALRGL
jgi:hypothetical protein